MKSHDTADGKDAVDANSHHAGNRHALFVIPLLALFIISPLVVHGCSCGNDFNFHLVSWFEAAAQIGHGNLHPHWAYTPAWDAGEPRFVFYPPLSWYLGALLGLTLTHLPHIGEAAAWTAVPIAFTWTALSFSGLTMCRLARRYAGSSVALFVAAIYMANPYMLFTAYERTAYGELLAAAWIPLLLDGILRKRITITGIALPVALLLLTNVPAAVMGCYALALLAVIRLCMRQVESHERVNLFAGAVLGLGLAAIYIVPAAYDRRYVQTAMATIGGMKIDTNFLFGHTGNTPDDLLHDQVLRTASWIAVALLIATGAALITACRKSHSQAASRQLPIAPLATLTLVIAFLLTPLSAPIWNHTPELAFLQFPWRLLALLTPVLAVAIAAALPNAFLSTKAPYAWVLSTKAVLAALLAVAILGLPAWHIFRQLCGPEDSVAARIALFHSSVGTDPTDEYTSVTADNDALQSNNPPYWFGDTADAGPSPTPASVARTALTHQAIDLSRPEFLILNLRDYSAWRIVLTRSGNASHTIPDRIPRADGLIAIPVPAGQSVIDIRYIQSAEQSTGDAISLCALGIFAIFAVGKKQLSRVQPG